MRGFTIVCALLGLLAGLPAIADEQPTAPEVYKPIPAESLQPAPTAKAVELQSLNPGRYPRSAPQLVPGPAPPSYHAPTAARVFPNPCAAAAAAPPEKPAATADRLEHLIRAVGHLEAAGELEEARRIHRLAEEERRALLDRLKDLETEVDRLRELTGTATSILVEVQVMEISRSKLRKLGVDYAEAREGAGHDRDQPEVPNVDAWAAAFHGSCFLEPDDGRLRLLEALKKDKLVKVLAEPTLVTLSGRPATLQIGGEYPVMEPEPDGSHRVGYKSYGTRVDLLARTVGDDIIRLEIRPEISELDHTLAIDVGEHSFPARRVREMDTTVEIRSGYTFVIGGLVQQRKVTENTKASNDEPLEDDLIELLVLVTPQIVEPATAAKAKTGVTTYPYYTTRGPRDFLADQPRSIER